MVLQDEILEAKKGSNHHSKVLEKLPSKEILLDHQERISEDASYAEI